MESAQYDPAPTSESYLGSDEETELETELETEEESEGEEETTAETEEELDSSRLTDQNEENKTKEECIISDPSFSMVTVQREDSGITWETSSSRSSTPWASESSLTSDMYSMEGSTVSSPPGNISFILDEGKKVRKRAHKSSSKHGSPALRRKEGKKRHSLEGQPDVPANAKDKTSLSDGKSEQEKSSFGIYDKTRKKKTVSNTPPITGAIYKEHKPLVLRPVYIGTVQYKIKMFNSVKEEIIPLQFYGTLPKGYVIKEINYRKGKDASITLEPDANQGSSISSKASKSMTQNIESNKEKQLSPPWREAISKESRMPSFLKDTEKSKEINSFSPPASGLKHTVSSYSSNEIMEPQSLPLSDSAIPVEETSMNEIQIDSPDAAASELMSPKLVKEELKADTQETAVLPPTFSTSPSFVDEVGEEERESDLLATAATSISENLSSTKAEQEAFESDSPVTAASAPGSLDTKVENLGLSSLEKEEPVSPAGEWETEETKPEPPALREMKEEEGDVSLPITSGPELESSYVSEEEIIEIDYPESLSPSENAIPPPLVHEGEREEAEPDLPLLATSTSENVALLEKEREDIGLISPDSDFASEFSSLSYSTHELEEQEIKRVSPPAVLSPSECEILSEEETLPCSPEFTSVSEYSTTSPTAEEDGIEYQSPIHLASTSEAAIFSEEETLESERYTPDSTSASEYSIPPYAAQELQKEETGQRTPLSSIATAEHMIISEEEKDDIGPYSPDSAFVSEFSVSPHPIRESEKEESEQDYPIHATSPSEHTTLNEEENEEIEPFSPDSASDFSVPPYTTPEPEKKADEPSSLETAMSVSEYSIFSEAEKEEMEPEIRAATMPVPEQTILSQKQKAQHSSALPEQVKLPPSAAEADKGEAKPNSQTDATSVSEHLILSQKQKIESASKVLESEHSILPSSTDEREKEEIRPDSSIPAFMKAGSSEKEKVKPVLPQTPVTGSQESTVPKSTQEEKKELGQEPPHAQKVASEHSAFSKVSKEEIMSSSQVTPPEHPASMLQKEMEPHSPRAPEYVMESSVAPGKAGEKVGSDSMSVETPVPQQEASLKNKENLKDNQQAKSLAGFEVSQTETKEKVRQDKEQAAIPKSQHLVSSKSEKEETPHLPELKFSSLSEKNQKEIGLDSPQATASEVKPSPLPKTVKEEIQSDSPLPTASVSDAVLSKASKEELKISSLSEENKKGIGLDSPQATASEVKPSFLPKTVKEEIQSDSPLLTASVSDAVLSKEKVDLSSPSTDHLVLNEKQKKIGEPGSSPIETAAAKFPVWSEVDKEVNLHAPSSARDSAEHAVLSEMVKEKEKPESPMPEHSFLSKVGNDQDVPPLKVPAAERSTLSEKQASESSTPASMTGGTVPPYMTVEMEKKDTKVPSSKTVISVSDQRVTSQEKEETKYPLHELETLGTEDLSMKSITPTGEKSRQEPEMFLSDKSHLLSEKPTVPLSSQPVEPALELSGGVAELSQGLVSENGHRDAKQEISLVSATGSSVLERAKSEAKNREEGKQECKPVSAEVVSMVSDQSVASFVEKENPELQQDHFSLKDLLEESSDLVVSNEGKKQKSHPLTSVGNLVPQDTGDVLTKTNENDVQTPSFLLSQNVPEPSKMASFDLSEEQARQKSTLCPDDIVNLSDPSIRSPLVDQKDIGTKSPSFAEVNLPLEESKSIVPIEPRDVKDAKESLSLKKEGIWLQKEQSQEQTRPDKERVLESGQLYSSVTDGRPLGQLMSVSPEKKQTFEHIKQENIYPAEEPDLSAQTPTSPLGRPDDHREQLTTQTYFSPEIQMAEKPKSTVLVEKASRPEVNEKQFSPLGAPESVISEKLSPEDVQEKFTSTSESATKVQMQVSGDRIREKVKPAIIPSSVKATSCLAEDSITVLTSEKEDLRSTSYSSTEKRLLEESKTDTSKVAKIADEVQQPKSEKPKSEVKILMQEKSALDSPELINKVPEQAETSPSTVTDGKAKKGVSSFTSWMASLFFGASAPENNVDEKEALPSPAADTSVLEGEVKMTVPAIPDDFNEAEKPAPSPLSVSGLLPEKEPKAILIKANEEREQKETPLSLTNQVDKESSKLTPLRVEKMSHKSEVPQTHHLPESRLLSGAESRTALTESGKPRQLKEDSMFLSAMEEDEHQQLSFAKADLFREPQSTSVGPTERNKEDSYQSPLAKKEKLILGRSEAITVSPEEEGGQKESVTDLALGENNQRTQPHSAGRTNFASKESGITFGISHDEVENLKNQTYSLAKAKSITGESQMVAHPEIKETKTVGIQPSSLREKDSLEEKTKTLIPTSPGHRVKADQENICALPDVESLRSKVSSHSEEKEQHLLSSDIPHAMVEPSKEILPDITKESKKQESQPEFGRLVSRESKTLDSPFDESRSLDQLSSSPEAIFSPVKSPNVISVSSPEVNKSEISSPELTGAGQTYRAKDDVAHSPVPSTFVSKQVSDFQTKPMEDFQVDKPSPPAVHDSNEATCDMPSTSRKEISSIGGIMKESENLFVKDGAFAAPMVTSKPPGLTEDQKNAFSIISEGCEILNIHAPAFISSVDEEECEKMRDKLEYLEEKTSQSIQPLHDVSEVTEGHEVLRNESLAGDSDVAISLGKGKIQEKTHPAEEDISTDSDVPFSYHTMPSDVDYFEKYTLIDYNISKEPLKKESFQKQDIEGEPQKKIPEETTSFPESSADKTLESDLVKLDESFYGMEKEDGKVSYKESQSSSPTLRSTDSETPRDVNRDVKSKSPGMPLFSAEEGVLSRTQLFPMEPKAINPELLEEQPALAFLYKDLYEEAGGDKKKEGETISDKESVNSDGSFPNRHSDAEEETGMYFEKYILKDEMLHDASGYQKDQSQPMEEIPVDKDDSGQVKAGKGEVWGRFGTTLGEKSMEEEQRAMVDEGELRGSVENHKNKEVQGKEPITEEVQLASQKISYAVPFQDTHDILERVDEHVDQANEEENASPEVSQHFPVEVSYPEEESMSGATAAPERLQVEPQGFVPSEIKASRPCSSPVQDEYEFAESMSYGVATQENLLSDDLFSESTPEDVLSQGKESCELIGENAELVKEEEQSRSVPQKDLGSEAVEPERPLAEAEDAQKEAKKSQIDTYCYTCKCPISAIDKLFGEHKDHEVAALDTAIDVVKIQLGEFLDNLKEKSLKIEAFVTEIESFFNTIEENCSKNEKRLEEQNEEMMKKVLAQYDEKAQSFEEVKKRKMEYLHEQMVNFLQSMDTAKETLETIVKEAEELDETVFLTECLLLDRLLSAMESTASLENIPTAFSLFEHYDDRSTRSDQMSKQVAVPQPPILEPQEPNSATSTTITVYWSVRKEDVIESFQVYCMEDPQEDGEANDLVEEYRLTVKESYCLFEDLEPGRCYQVWVMAVNFTGCSLPSERAIFRTAPSTPIIKAEDCTVCWNTATIRWSSANPRAADAYTVEYCRQHSPEGEGLRSYSGIKGFQLKVNLQPNDNYFFYAKAVNAFGTSEQSEAALISTRGTRFLLLRETAHPALQISLDGTVIRFTERRRLTETPSVLGEQLPPCGQHYWETTVTDCTAYRLGICSSSNMQGSALGQGDASWYMHCSEPQRYKFFSNGTVSNVHVTEHAVRVGILLDYSNQRLLFINAESGQLLFTIRHRFTGPIHPAFALEKPGQFTLHLGKEPPDFLRHK